MSRQTVLTHTFVDMIPDVLQDGVVYVCIPFGTAVHKCCCGCEMEVVTPISPARWQLIFDRETISLYPSVGNFNFPCQSHYWISRDRVVWSDAWTEDEIRAGRRRDHAAMRAYLAGKTMPAQTEDDLTDAGLVQEEARASWWQRFRRWLGF